MINLVFAVYSKTGTLLLGPVDTGALWAGFPIDECTEPSGDPIVIYDQFADRWILTQFTTRGLDDPRAADPFYNCVADLARPATRPARTTGTRSSPPDRGQLFPDYPKYGVWRDSYLITTREFGIVDRVDLRHRRLRARAEQDDRRRPERPRRAVLPRLQTSVPLNLIGDGLLPPDIDGKQKPKNDAPAPIVGTQDDGGALRRDLRRAEHLGVRRQVALDADRVDRAQDAAAGRAVRLDLPVRADVPRLPAAAGHHQPGPVPRHPVLPAAADLAARVPELQGLRGAGDQPVGRGAPGRRRARGGTRSGGRTARTPSTSRARTRPTTASTAGWAASPRTRRATWPSATASSTARRVPGHPLHGPARRRPARADDARRRHGHQRHRRADDHELALGRLHVA